ncbi:hypothetical protein [Haliovirga abyssi]|uniref:Porin n=1 Tax=Haliovirga abyssi TaxID=2996794 RepID=A0AAU9DQG3_9FUSO|nr:hypothetical protein [Haliovirga abyssi]BDU50713.1 hypothetical protein HLVA_12820 [Haliovirga abyssi]
MKKNLVIIMLFVLTAVSFSQENGSAGVGMGVLKQGDESTPVLKMNFSPELQFGRLGLGLKLGIYLTSGGLADYNNDGKKDMHDIDFGFKYIYWNGEIFKFRYGVLNNYILGHGTLVNRYSNNEKTSLVLGINLPEKAAGIEGFMPLKKDILGSAIPTEEQPHAVGGRVYVRPLKVMGTAIPVINNSEIGVTYVTDNRDEFSGVKGSVDGTAYEFAIPLLEDQNASFIPYYDLVKVNGELGEKSNDGSGNFIGVMGKVAIIDYRLEYRDIDRNLIPGYFGKFYEISAIDNLNYLIGTESNEKVKGYFGNVDFDFMGTAKFTLSYEDYKDENIKPHLFAKLDVTPTKKLKSTIIYEQQNMGAENHKDNFLNEDTYVKAHIIAPGYMFGVPGPTNVAIDIKQTYFYDNDKNEYVPNRDYSMNIIFNF